MFWFFFFTKILCLAFLSLWISIWNQSSIKEKNVKDMNSCSFIVYVYGSFMQTILIYSWRFSYLCSKLSDRLRLLDPTGFLAIFRHLLFPPSCPSFATLGKCDDRFMDSLDNSGSGGGSWRICQAAADTRSHRFSGNQQGMYTRKDIPHGASRGASFLPAWPAKLANQIRSRPSCGSSSRGKVRIYSRPGVSPAQ